MNRSSPREASGAIAAVDPVSRQRLDGMFRSEALRLHRFFRRRTRCEETAADMVQETFLRLANSPTGRRLDNPLPYLQRIARNLLFDRNRSAETRLRGLHVEYDDGGDAPVAPAQGLLIEAEDLLKRYEVALASMTPKTRDVFVLHRIEDLTYRQIARQLGITIGTVEYHMARALVHLDRELGEEQR